MHGFVLNALPTSLLGHSGGQSAVHEDEGTDRSEAKKAKKLRPNKGRGSASPLSSLGVYGEIASQ